MSRLLPYLPALACPLVMLVCMAGMRRMGSAPTQTQEPAATIAERIAHLEELAALRAEQQHTDQAPTPTSKPALARPPADPPSAPAGRVS
jgi:hypothetical protein